MLRHRVLNVIKPLWHKHRIQQKQTFHPFGSAASALRSSKLKTIDSTATLGLLPAHLCIELDFAMAFSSSRKTKAFRWRTLQNGGGFRWVLIVLRTQIFSQWVLRSRRPWCI